MDSVRTEESFSWSAVITSPGTHVGEGSRRWHTGAV